MFARIVESMDGLQVIARIFEAKGGRTPKNPSWLCPR